MSEYIRPYVVKIPTPPPDKCPCCQATIEKVSPFSALCYCHQCQCGWLRNEYMRQNGRMGVGYIRVEMQEP